MARYVLACILLSVSGFGATNGDPRIADAAMRGDKVALRALLQQKVDLNQPQADGTTALHWAARRDDLDSADLLLRGGANANAATRYGVTPLSLAATNGNAAMIEKLLAAFPFVAASDSGVTP